MILLNENSKLYAHRYRYLLLSQFLFVVLYSLFEGRSGALVLLEVTLLITLLISAFIAVAQRKHFLFVCVLAFMMLLLRWIAVVVDSQSLAIVSAALAVLFFVYIVVIISTDIFVRAEKVSADLIYGAVSVYWMIGMAFAFIYVLLEFASPGSFSNIALSVDAEQPTLSSYVYFSFVTLSTLGYGDMTPLTRHAGVTAYMEAILGQLYLAILMARLVGMYLADVQKK